MYTIACTASPVAARQSSRRLASMQGARIKACGSFPPQIVLALTISKITRRCLALRRFAGTPKQNHPKISCSEDRFLSFRSGIFPQDNTDGLVAILFGAFARSRFANMYTIGCRRKAKFAAPCKHARCPHQSLRLLSPTNRARFDPIKNNSAAPHAAPFCGDPKTTSSENLLLSGAGSSAPGDPGGVRAAHIISGRNSSQTV